MDAVPGNIMSSEDSEYAFIKLDFEVLQGGNALTVITAYEFEDLNLLL